MSRSNDNYNDEHPRYRYPVWHHFTWRGIGKANKALLYKRKAKRILDCEMRQEHDRMSLTPWSKMNDYSRYW